MCKMLGLLFFLAGGGGCILLNMEKQQLHTKALLECRQSLLRLHGLIVKRGIPLPQALQIEQTYLEREEKNEWLHIFYESLFQRMILHKEGSVTILLQDMEKQCLKERLKAEEVRLFLECFTMLLSLQRKEDDRSFWDFFEQLDGIRKQDYNTRGERRKVTVCTMGTGFVMLLLLLI